MKFKKSLTENIAKEPAVRLTESKVDDAFAKMDDPKAAEYIPVDYSEKEKKLARFLENRVDMEPVAQPNEITDALDDSLRAVMKAKRAGKSNVGGLDVNILLVGRAGVGKTSIVKQWCNARHVNLVEKSANGLDKSDLVGVVGFESDEETGNRTNKVDRYGNGEFDQLDEPASVLFLDEINYASPDTLAALLKLINEHILPDNHEPGGVRYFPNFLFTVAAMNPAKAGYAGTKTLNTAMRNRFQIMNIEANMKSWRKWLLTYWQKEIADDAADYNRLKYCGKEFPQFGPE